MTAQYYRGVTPLTPISAIAKRWWAFPMVSLVLPFTDTGDGVTILILLCALAAVTGFAIATTVLIRR